MKPDRESSLSNAALPLGLCLGAGLGTLWDNLALGISLGLLFGLALSRLRLK